jgi:hypothetical protein
MILTSSLDPLAGTPIDRQPVPASCAGPRVDPDAHRDLARAKT